MEARIIKTSIDFLKMKEDGEKIVMLTAYDYPTAQFVEGAGVDIILVGDSVGMVVLGYDSTTSVTAAEMIHHGKAVRRGAKDTFIVVDMPFGTFHGSHETILRNAVQILQETNANALKVEGADEVIDTVRMLTKTGIPVVGHLGLLPQFAGVAGGYKVQAKTAKAGKQLIKDALACERAGAIMIVLECIPHQLAAEVTKALSIPVIGIGAGAQTDGQVLVFHDLVTFGSYRIPKFVEQFVDVGTIVNNGVSAYVEAVKSNKFPTEKHQFTMEDTELNILLESKDGDA